MLRYMPSSSLQSKSRTATSRLELLEPLKEVLVLEASVVSDDKAPGVGVDAIAREACDRERDRVCRAVQVWSREYQYITTAWEALQPPQI